MVLACRDEKRGEQLRISLEENAKQHGNSKPQAEVMLLDVSSLQSVRSFAEQWNQRQQQLHCLINNAGIFDIGGGMIPFQLCTSNPESAVSELPSNFLLVWSCLTIRQRSVQMQ